MRNLVSILAMTLCSMVATANAYQGTLKIKVAAQETPESNIALNINSTEADLYSLSMSNVSYVLNEQTVVLGDIVVDGLKVNNNNGKVSLIFDNSKVSMGGNAVPATFFARFTDAHAALDMELRTDEAYYYLHFDNVGKDFQIKNSDFEQWTASSGEAVNWHSFKSASGSLASAASSTFGKSTDVRQGTTGQYSAVVTSNSVFGIVANGTMTNGQLNAGNMSAANTSNNSHMDKASTARDKDDNPFYTPVLAQPDSISVWMKFSQGTANKSYPYCTISAIVYDDTSTEGVTYYQDPENKAYANVVARAKKSDIVVSGWTQYKIPFTFEAKTDANKSSDAILVTMSTNATPGKGSKGDQVFVDDLELVYAAGIKSVKYQDSPITFQNHQATYPTTVATAPTAADFTVEHIGASAVSGVQVVEMGTCYLAYIVVASGDLLTTEVYTVQFNKELKSLADVLTTAQENDNVTVSTLYVVKALATENGGVIYTTDGDDNWIALNCNEAKFNELKDAAVINGADGTIKGLSKNPELEVNNVSSAETGAPFMTYSQIHLDHHFTAKPNGVYIVIGYFDADGKLRAYSGSNGNMGQSLNVDKRYMSSTVFEQGKPYGLIAVFTLNDQWDTTSNAPSKIAPSDERYYDNYTIYPIDTDATVVTGIDNVETAETVTSVRYYNVAGIQMDGMQSGLNIVVKTMSNGNVKVEKVIK